MLKNNSNCILTTLDKLDRILALDADKNKYLELLLHKIRDTGRISKKFLESLKGEWWRSDR